MSAPNMEARTDYPVTDLIRRRWSPRAFADRAIEPEKLWSLFEAARWAPSSYNEQPWSYVVAPRGDAAAFQRLLETLVPFNQQWAKGAGALAISVASTKFQRNGKPNPHAQHDVGLASENLSLQATSLGLAVHQMAGFDPEKARELLNIPEGYEPVAAMAIGYPADPDSLSPEAREKEFAPRTRRPAAEFVFQGTWGKTSKS